METPKGRKYLMTSEHHMKCTGAWQISWHHLGNLLLLQTIASLPIETLHLVIINAQTNFVLLKKPSFIPNMHENNFVHAGLQPLPYVTSRVKILRVITANFYNETKDNEV